MEIINEHTAAVIIAAYFLIINITGFAMAFFDKRKSEKGKRRISEPTLFFVSFIGGSIGMLIGMKKFRHKTKQKRFMIGIPIMIVLQLALAAVIICCLLFV
ncbi:MAG: DUF1294 domain-containing protein [Oscillospiraceae bacterium]